MYIDLIVTDKKEWASSSKYLQKCLPGAISVDMSGNLSIKPLFFKIKAYSLGAPIRNLVINDHARIGSVGNKVTPSHQFGNAWLYLHDIKRHIKGTRFDKKGRLYLLGCRVSRCKKICSSIAKAIQVPVVASPDDTYGDAYKGKPTLYTPNSWREFDPNGRERFYQFDVVIYPTINGKKTRCKEIRFAP